MPVSPRCQLGRNFGTPSFLDNKTFTPALIQRKLKQSDQLDFEEEWRLVDSYGGPVPAGNYTIEVTVMIGLESGNVGLDELTARSTFAIGVAAEL